ncbi:MAG: hypothetical protein HQL98_02585 [Magnetococcales bacterium]|nr:hypothetical protein [Magnetococcales bacterium]
MKKSILALTVALGLGLGLAGTVASVDAAERVASKGTMIMAAATDPATDKHATHAKATKKAKKKTKKKAAAATKTDTLITK